MPFHRRLAILAGFAVVLMWEEISYMVVRKSSEREVIKTAEQIQQDYLNERKRMMGND